ncbi:YfhO family protein, partial [Arachidicoccus sp.]|uniref:YfhO family protein n=1 Tax=Arachidicoccus sp. TaxID=1872624 RepID=UPI003D203285
NTHLFSGMPNYQVAMDGHSFLPNFGDILTLWLPKPISFFFLACICFYILTQSFRIKPIIGVLASLAFAYATYTPIIIVAGHETKMLAMAYMPAMLAGLILLYEKRYALGSIVSTLFATLEISAGHPQITYYFLICVAIMTIFYVINWIKTRQIKHCVAALSLALLAGLIGLGSSALGIFPTYQYAKYTIRGGSALDVTSQGIKKVTKTSGLDESYAFQYSMGKAEVLELAMPNAFGGSTGNMFDESSDVYNNAMQLGQQLNGKMAPQQLNMVMRSVLSKYWGGVVPFTSGPVYAGTLIVLLAIIGWVAIESKHKWWLLVVTLFGVLMAWGSYFESFNLFLFHYLPMYNKFRAPSMAMVIPQLILPLMAAVGLQKLFYKDAAQEFLQKNFKKILYALGGFIALLLLVYVGNDYSLSDASLKEFLMQPQINGSSIIHSIEDARKSMFLAGIGRVVLFSVIIIIGLYLFAKKALSAAVILAAFLVINTFDLLKVDNTYLNTSNYMQPDELQASSFTPTSADLAIMQDKSPHYRVLNLTSGDPFTDAITSYFHRSIGGYHPAKLSVYQDLVASQLSGKINPSVLNMLDTRYIISPDKQGQPIVQTNPDALGAAWFVKGIQYVPSDLQEIESIGHFNAKDTAIVQSKFMSDIGSSISFDSTATIKLLQYDNDTISYATSAKSPQFAVLSEIYYPAGWNAYIDGKKTNYVKSDFALRGIAVPAGKHEIMFRFEPNVLKISQTIVYIANILFWLSIAFSIFIIWKKEKKVEN